MGSPDHCSTLLDSLPARPPTPPREHSRDPDSHLKQLIAAHPNDSRLNLQTPPTNPHSPSSSTKNSSSRRKKVEFSAQAEYKDPPVYIDGQPARQNPTPVSVPPPSSSRPAKSILKVAYGPNPLDPSSSIDSHGDPTHQVNIVAMLDSTIQQLAGADRDSRLDAYRTLVQALKVSNNLPDRIALQDKMSLFMQFIQRDMTSKTAAGSSDSTLIIHALNLLCTFLHFPAIASTLSNDFGAHVIDHCIRSFEDAHAPKDVVRHLMQVVALQNVSPKVMTSDRVGRLISALHKIEEHMRGKSIIVSRILIYRRLIQQCRQLMATHTDWLPDLFTDMLSSMKEIRASAISLGLEAAFAVGREKHTSRKAMEMFQLTAGDTTYIQFYAEQLKSMARNKVDAPSVPRIWSVVILLLRVPERWDSLSEWLHIIQTCFNSSDYHTKHEANFAWNRLVYCLQREDRSFTKMISTLTQPLTSQLRRKGTGKQAEDLRRVVLGGVCNLFYYAYRPTTNLVLLDAYWDNSVKPVMQQLIDRRLEQESHNDGEACAILTGLFDCTTPRLWREDHVADNPLVRSEELPAIDSKWIRQNGPRIFSLVGQILEKNFLDLSNPRSATHKLWRTLIATVASAASKEVKVSMDTATFVGCVMGFILRVWNGGLREVGESDKSISVQFLGGMRELLLVMIDSLGLLPFTEKQLVMDQQNTFKPVSTPSHRSAKGQSGSRSPFQHLFSILSTLPQGISDDDDFAEFVKSVFTPFFSTKSDKGQVDLALELIQLIPMDALCPYGPWVLAAERISAGLNPSQSSHLSAGSSGGTPVGLEFREVVRVLERGLRATPNLPWRHWLELFHNISEQVRDETGDAGLAICLIEPLAKATLELKTRDTLISDVKFNVALELLNVAAHPRDRQAVEAARRRLWGTAITSSRSASFDPFDNLYKLVDWALLRLYDEFGPTQSEEAVATVMKELLGFFERCSTRSFVQALAPLQGGISCWIQDEKARIHSRQTPAVAEATRLLWDRICSALANTEDAGVFPLDTLETLLCAAFTSKHRHIVNMVSSLWNRVFEDAQEISYPEKLKNILVTSQQYVDVILPGLATSSSGPEAEQPVFIDSQEDMKAIDIVSAKSEQRAASRPSSAHSSSSPLTVNLNLSRKRKLDASSGIKAPKIARRAAAPKLRHDDSQVEFAAIESSPHGSPGLESQHLTDRQREVRERQREQAAMFSELKSSPAGRTRTPRSRAATSPVDEFKDCSEPPRAATPEADGGFDDYITSTPTPRRGQALPMPEHDNDLGDPPSSPPEPRRYPLLPEIKSRSNSNDILDQWHFTSSPVSSPTATHHTERVASKQRSLQEGSERDMELDNALDSDQAAGSNSGSDADIVRDSAVFERQEKTEAPAKPSDSDKLGGSAPVTPSRCLRSIVPQETPRSDNDVYVDAPSSPLPVTPKPHQNRRRSSRANRGSNAHSQPKDGSLVVSDVDERSLLRLVHELDEHDRPGQSTSKAVDGAPAAHQARGNPVLDCITVNTGSEKSQGRRSKRSRSSTSSLAHVTTSTATEGEAEKLISSSQEAAYSTRQKRKRSLSHAGSSGGMKKTRRQASGTKSDEVPDGQDAQPAQGAALSACDESSLPDPVALEASSEEMKAPGIEECGSSAQDVVSQTSPADGRGLSEGISQPAEVDPGNEDEALQSQLAGEQEAQSQREQSQVDPEPIQIVGNTLASEVIDGYNDENAEPDRQVDEAAKPEEAEPETEVGELEQPQGKTEGILSMLRSGLEALQSVALSREEVYKVEDLCMDIRRELYEAERRGRP